MKENSKKHIIEFFGPFKKIFGGIFLFVVIQQAVMLATPVFYGKVIDSIFAGDEVRETLVFVLLAAVFYLLGSITGYLRDRYEINNFDFEIQRHLNVKGMEKNLSFSLGQHYNENSGIKQSVLSRGQHSLTSLAYTFPYEVIPQVLRVLFVVGAITYLNFIIGGIMFLGAVLFYIFIVFVNRKYRGDMKKLQKMWNENSKLEAEIIRNVGVVQMNVQEKRVVEEFDNDYRKIIKKGKSVWGGFVSLGFLRDIVSIITRIAVMVAGVVFVAKGIFTPGYLVILLSWSMDAFSGLGYLSHIHRGIMQAYPAVKKLFVMFDVQADVKNLPDAKKKKITGKIEFKNISFSYPTKKYLSDDDDGDDENIHTEKTDEREVLSGASFTIEPGEHVALVGESGAGKTTSVQLLLRAYDPEKGEILVDGENLKNLDLYDYRKQIGYVEQDVSVFDNTLFYNIAFSTGRKNVSGKELDDVARTSKIDAFLPRLQKGYKTEIGERGVRLSGGERQRIGIARALIKNPKILIFDEATSNLDATNEKLIRDAIKKASRGRTTIIIAHRFSTIKNVDKIIVFKKGKVVGIGTHESLIGTCPEYQRLVKDQILEQ